MMFVLLSILSPKLNQLPYLIRFYEKAFLSQAIQTDCVNTYAEVGNQHDVEEKYAQNRSCR